MDKSLYEQVEEAIDKRKSWAAKQTKWYETRAGLRKRASNPYPNAPDLHYPLGDTLIEKLKPAYIQQLYGGETIANFVALRQQDEDLTSAAAHYYDYFLKQKSNFERTMYVAIDQMLESAFAPIKVYWDAKAKRLAWDSIDPIHVIVPATTQEYNENGGADWLVHVLHMSVDEYRAKENFKQDEEFIKRIKGKGGDSDGEDKKQTSDLKEGINCSSNENEIVLWECYKKDRKGSRIEIEIVTPLLSCESEENVVRPKFGLPYNKGCFADGVTYPFFKIRSEIKGKGYYASRGLMEINAPFEGSLTKSWNTIHEWQDFFTKPMFENIFDTPPNAANFKNKPGGILPKGLKPVMMPHEPSSLREGMEMTRAIAEDRSQIPDLGANQHLAGSQGQGGKPTATQINAVVGQSGQGSDMRARVFRLDMAVGLHMGWSLYLQYADRQNSFQYVVENEIKTMEESAFHDEYELVPTGSADSWNKGAMVAKRTAMYQMFQGNPFVPLDELTKWVLEAEDPRLVKRLFKDPGFTASTEAEDQSVECLLMAANTAPVVEPADDDKVHLQILDQFVKDKIQRVEMTPEIARLCLQHGTEHMGALKEKKDPMLKAVEAKLRPTAELLAQIAAQPDPPPKNVTQMPLQQPQADQSLNQGSNEPALAAASPVSQPMPNTGAQ